MYKQAIRENYTFETNVGVLTVGQLFKASDETLTKLENKLTKDVEEAKTPNRFQKTETNDKTLKNKLAIVTDVIDTIIAEREDQTNEVARKAELDELLAEKLRRQKEGVKDISDKELDKKIAKLNG